MSDEKQNSKNGLGHSIIANGKEEHKTETEQLYDDMTGKNEAEEQDEQEDEAQDEPILSEEELEIQREIESYQSKIETLDAKLAAHEAQHIDAIKREQMKKAYYSDEQIERYLSHIEGETADEIKAYVLKLSLEIPPANDNFADPSPFNGRAAKPKTVDHTEIGRQAFGRIKHKIFPWMR